MPKELVGKWQYSTGVGNLADPTVWRRYQRTFLGGRIHVDLHESWGIVARITLVIGRKRREPFISELYHARLHRYAVRLFESLDDILFRQQQSQDWVDPMGNPADYI